MRPAPSDPPEIAGDLWNAFEGVVAWDIGANTGQSLRELAQRFHQIIAFEPAAECWPLLERSAAAARCDITIVNEAVSDTDGFITLAVVPDKIDSGQLVTYGTTGMEWSAESAGTLPRPVPAHTLDSLVEEYPAPDFLKIDVEGHELKVLTGGWQLITDYSPNMLIEFHSPKLYADCVECLTVHGYRWITTVRHPHYAYDSPMYHTHGWIRAFYR